MRAWEKNFREVEPYVPGEQPQEQQIIKLNTNENPYPPAPKVAKVLESMNTELFKLYPDYQSKKLVQSLAKQYEVDEKQVFVGVGSDDVLAVSFLAFFNSKTPILFPDITYSFYKVWAQLYQIPYECPKLSKDFRIVKEDYYKKNGGIVIANPNAPTSIYEDIASIRDILDHNQESVVIIDEAYIDFGGESVISLVKEYENLLVVQTFSKSRSMAGMRIGFAIGNERLIKTLNDVKYSINSYTMNMTSIELGTATVEENEYYKKITNRIIETREEARVRLAELGFETMESSTNFLFVTHKSMPANQIFHDLNQKKIYVRHFNIDRISNYLRITIGTPEQMNTLYDALEEIVKIKAR